MHDWWYRCLHRAGIVDEGVTPVSGCTRPVTPPASACSTPPGNLKAVQKLLGHASIQTTGDIYNDWDDEQLAQSLLEAVEDQEWD